MHQILTDTLYTSYLLNNCDETTKNARLGLSSIKFHPEQLSYIQNNLHDHLYKKPHTNPGATPDLSG